MPRIAAPSPGRRVLRRRAEQASWCAHRAPGARRGAGRGPRRRTLGGDEQAWKALLIALAPFVERIAGRFRVTPAAFRRARTSARHRRPRDGRAAGEGLPGACGRCSIAFGSGMGRTRGGSRPWPGTRRSSTHGSTPSTSERPTGSAGGAGRIDPRSRTIKEEAANPLRAIEARRILAFAREHLSPAQRDALDLWLQGCDPADIAYELGLEDGAAATRLVRSAIARLRREYRGEGHEGNGGGLVTDRFRKSVWEETRNRPMRRRGAGGGEAITRQVSSWQLSGGSGPCSG